MHPTGCARVTCNASTPVLPNRRCQQPALAMHEHQVGRHTSIVLQNSVLKGTKRVLGQRWLHMAPMQTCGRARDGNCNQVTSSSQQSDQRGGAHPEHCSVLAHIWHLQGLTASEVQCCSRAREAATVCGRFWALFELTSLTRTRSRTITAQGPCQVLSGISGLALRYNVTLHTKQHHMRSASDCLTGHHATTPCDGLRELRPTSTFVMPRSQSQESKQVSLR